MLGSDVEAGVISVLRHCVASEAMIHCLGGMIAPCRFGDAHEVSTSVCIPPSRLTPYRSSILQRHLTVMCMQGNIDGHKHSYQLDDHHTFVSGKPMLVCGNTAAMVGEQGHSWLAKSFDVSQTAN